MARERDFVTAGAGATCALAEDLGRRLPRGAVIALDGDLGAGKTTFVRGLALGLGLDEQVTSPTFTLMHRYGDGAGRVLDHFDAWMEGRERAFLAYGGGEALVGADVAAIEWAGRVVDWLPPERLEVHLGHLGPEERSVGFRVRGEGPVALALEEALAGLTPPPGAREADGGAPRAPTEGAGG
jgi:tRNA threonylcarbamoyladenosine biosynthesis protein TsaE